jgi:phosphoribosylamine--glycine ligase
MKNVAVLGVSGRQSAIVWKLAQSPSIETIYFIPGNILQVDKAVSVSIDYHDWEQIDTFLKDKNIAYIIPDGGDMYADGVVDFFTARGYKVFGPTQTASKLEHSKIFSKGFMKKYGIPTVSYEAFGSYPDAKEFIEQNSTYPIVIKADGLVRGRGVTIAQTHDEALEVLEELFINQIFGDAGLQVVIEDFAVGPEVSLHVLCDGASYKILPLAQDHKPLYEGNKGPNTGGMGTYAPVDWVPSDLHTEIEETIIKPTLAGLQAEGIEFTGLLFPGLMLTKDGPIVLEYNTRFGAPETQSLMMLLDSDLDELFEASVHKRLDSIDLRWKNKYATTIEVVDDGYPQDLRGRDTEIIVNDELHFDGQIFLTGVVKVDQQLRTKGARIASVTGIGDSLSSALDEAYKGVSLLSFEGKYYRKDIGKIPHDIPKRTN